MKARTCLFVLSLIGIGSNTLFDRADAFPQWTAGGANDNYTTAANWADSDFGFSFVPTAGDLAVHDNAGNTATLPAIQITSNVAADSLRLSHGGSVTHTSGTLTIENQFLRPDFTLALDNGLWVGEFGSRAFGGPSVNPSIYTLNGGSVTINDAFDGLQIGRGGGGSTFSDGRFDFLAGNLTYTGGDTNIGLDGYALFNHSGGVFNGEDVHVGHFASPNSTVNLSGSAQWNLTGALLMSDGQTIPPFQVRPEGPGVSVLNITGSNVSFSAANGMFLRGQATVNFVADNGGVSPIVLTGGNFELTDNNLPGQRPDLAVNLAAFPNATANITLIDASSLVFGKFQGLPEGATHPSFGNRRITYQGGADGFDVVLVNSASYVPPAPPTPLPDARIARWSMNLDGSNTSTFPFGNPKVLDSRTGSNEGTRTGAAGSATEDNLWFFSADNSHTYTVSNDVPPTSMFANGNNGGSFSYDASSVQDSFGEGGLFFPQDQYGNEFSFDSSFTLEAFIKTSDGVNDQQILVQGEGFNRFGLSMNEIDGGIRFSVNDGTIEESVDIGGSTGIGNANYGDGQWHYVFATFEQDAGANGTGQLTLAVANQDGSTSLISRDLSASFAGLPEEFNDGNLLIGTLDFNGQGPLGPVDPLRFHGLIDEVQISRGLLPTSQRLGVLNISEESGDFDGDGDVDGRDFLVWQRGGSPNPRSAADLALWKSQYGVGTLAAASAVPEPTSVVLLLVSVVALAARRVKS